MIYGYVDNQFETIQNVDELYFDQLRSETRPELNKLLNKLNSGDMLILKSISHLSLSLLPCIKILFLLINKNVTILSDNFNCSDHKDIITSLLNVPKRRLQLPRTPNPKPCEKIKFNEDLWNTYYNLWKQNAISKKEWSRKMKLSYMTFNRRFNERYPDEIKRKKQ